MKISILVPVYGVEKYIEKCARSLLEQSYDDIEYVFVDDASPDGSIDILRDLLGEYPRREVKIITNPHNLGIGRTRNVAIENASGDYTLFVDSDDWLDPDAVEKLAAKADATDADIVVFDSVEEFEKYSFIRREPFDYADRRDYVRDILWRRARVYLCTKLIRRRLYDDLYFEPGIDYGEDFMVLPQLVCRARTVAKLDEALYHYVQHNAASISATLDRTKAGQVVRAAEILERLLSPLPDYAPMIAGMKIHNKISLLQAGGRDVWRYARTLYPGLDYGKTPLKPQQRVALWLARTGLYFPMPLYRRMARWRKALRR